MRLRIYDCRLLIFTTGSKSESLFLVDNRKLAAYFFIDLCRLQLFEIDFALVKCLKPQLFV